MKESHEVVAMELQKDRTRRSLMKHGMIDRDNLMESIIDGPNPHSCPFCTFTCITEARLQVHVATQHHERGRSRSPASARSQAESPSPTNPINQRLVQQQQATLPCPLCQEPFKDRSQLEK